MKNSLLLFTTILLTVSCSKAYYISPDGDDNHTGKSPSKAWKTIEKINNTEFKPGSEILFQGGAVFEGTIRFSEKDRGTSDNRLIISSYGEGEAVIDGGDGEGLVAESCDNLIVSNLVFKGSDRKSGNKTDGIIISDCDSILLKNIEVFGFQHSGLHVHKTVYARIEYVYAHNNGFAGIHVTGSAMNDPVNYDNHNIYIGYCVAENNPGDPTVLKGHSGNGILACSVDGGIIEYCESFNNGWDMPWDGNGPVGIWIWDCSNFIIQYCISHDNKTHPGARDGGGFDLDGGVSNSVIQYCLSFNNEGTGIGLYEFGAVKPWQNNTIRYNISQNDGKTHDGSIGIWKAEEGTMRNCEIYNNTFYNSNPEGNTIWLYSNNAGFNFRNNVFVYNGRFLYAGHHIKNEVFQGNIYWNLTGGFEIEGYKSIEAWAKATGNEIVGGKVKGMFTDPLMVAPGTAVVTDPSKISPESLSGYMLKPGSPLINNGLDLKEIFGIERGERDILGSTIPQGEDYDIGAMEYYDN
jgi:hypothetical protein